MATFGEKSNYKLENGEDKHLTKLNDRFIRWHDKQITLLTFCINLLFTLSIATIGFIVNNFDDKIFKDKLFLSHSLPRTAAAIVVFSSLFGFAALLCRLFDFRYTKNTIRSRTFLFKVKNKIKYEYDKELTAEELNKKITTLTCWTKFLGCATLWLFGLQILTFFASIIIIVMNI